MNCDRFAAYLRERGYDAVDIGGLLLEVDVTDLDAVDVEVLIRAIERKAFAALS